ncbi:Ferric reduction oxidase 5 [Frankliniella fusca]|uniref:Ferric reduction oxidase 5 n=1 Tax=Frankliniella fusca TaxID=407009 RepID=A0AAE1HNR2_9NEOP|nr:Ferric reduction oxidase 5 [Frankliniella fusca]
MTRMRIATHFGAQAAILLLLPLLLAVVQAAAYNHTQAPPSPGWRRQLFRQWIEAVSLQRRAGVREGLQPKRFAYNA